VLFNSLMFVAFFAIVLVLHHLPLSWRVKKLNLLVASYLFYAAWNPPFVILLWISTLIDWWAAGAIHRSESAVRRKLLLLVSLATNLGLLAYFKYGDFLLDNLAGASGVLGVVWQAPAWDIILPVGISFYTFQTMAYTLDVYLDRAKPTGSFLDFALFVTFFPQLVAGPIVRPADLVPQFAAPRRASGRQFGWAMLLITLGLFLKIVVADGLLAPTADEVFGAAQALQPLDAWLGTLAFSGQIFGDFAGYTTIAIGCALALGFSLPDNFRYPYAAIGFSDFWRRWHISLSTWLRDYLYVPLGGNRRGAARTYANLMLTMLLGGLWHGAAWTFVVWGGLHGLYLAVERVLRARLGHMEIWRRAAMQFALGLLTYVLVNITWVFFRAQDFAGAWRLLRSMLLIESGGAPLLGSWAVLSTAATVALIVSTHWAMRNRQLHHVVERMPVLALGAVWGGMLLVLTMTHGGSDAFIYFQF
jgi:alginate O-acetyltransferase complex protein AlgI